MATNWRVYLSLFLALLVFPCASARAQEVRLVWTLEVREDGSIVTSPVDSLPAPLPIGQLVLRKLQTVVRPEDFTREDGPGPPAYRYWETWLSLSSDGQVIGQHAGYPDVLASAVTADFQHCIQIAKPEHSDSLTTNESVRTYHVAGLSAESRPYHPNAFRVSPTGRLGVYLSVTPRERTGIVIDLHSGAEIGRSQGMIVPRFTPDDKILCTTEWKGNVTARLGRLAVYDDAMTLLYSTPWHSYDVPVKPQPSSDGRFVYYLRGREHTLYSLDLGSGQEAMLSEIKGYVRWAVDGSALIAYGAGKSTKLQKMAIHGDDARVLWTIEKTDFLIQELAVSETGRYVALHTLRDIYSPFKDLTILDANGHVVEAAQREVEFAGLQFLGDDWLLEGTTYPGNWNGPIADKMMTTTLVHLYRLGTD